MFEGTFSPPVYNDRYNFLDGAQNDIFIDSYLSIPNPAPNAAMPILADVSAKSPIPTTSNNSNFNSSTPDPNACTSMPKTNTNPSDYSNSYKRDMSDVYKHSKNKRFAFMEMSRRSRRLNIHRRERLWDMW
jgi:hypothetical protein